MGISGSDGQDDGATDLSIGGDQPNPSSTTIYQRWCGPEANSCECGSRPGPSNDAFDLDRQNVIFTPNGEGGFFVNQVCTFVLPSILVLFHTTNNLTASSLTIVDLSSAS